MAKKLLALALALVLVVGLASCGSKPAEPEKPAEPTDVESAPEKEEAAAPEEETPENGEIPEIEFWDLIFTANPEGITRAEEVCAAYSEANNVHVKYVSVPWDNFFQTFLTAIAAGEAPDCSSGSSFMPQQMYDLDAVYPLNDTIAAMKADGDLDDFANPELIENYKYKGDYIGIPWGITTSVCYYRADILEEAGLEPPTNWDEMRHCLEVLNDPENNKYGFNLACNGTNGAFMFDWLINNGGGLFDENGNPDCMTERNLETVNYLLGLINDGLVSPAGPGMNLDDAKKAFAKGDSAFFWQGPGLLNELSNLGDAIQILPPIQNPHGESYVVENPAALQVYKDSEHPEIAADFIRYFTANMKEYTIEGGFALVPCRNYILDDPFYQDNRETNALIENYFPHFRTIGAVGTALFGDLTAIQCDGTLDAVCQMLFQPGMTAETILETEQANIENILSMSES